LLVLGVVLVRDVSNGGRVLTDLASIGTPVAAACCGRLLGWRRWWIAAVGAAVLFVVAWRVGGLVGDTAGTLLIAGACLSGAALLGRLAGPRELALGLVLLVVLDVVLVFGTSDVTRTTVTLHAVPPPSVGGSKPLPALQDVTLGPALMGWLDLLAPAILGVVLAGSRRRPAAAVAVVVTGIAWGTLLYTASTIPATVPVLAGLAVGFARRPSGAIAARRILPFP
jgi:hypothetical protein